MSSTLGNVFILGDSYSTFLGYNPKDCPAYYEPMADYSDVQRVEDTWWHMLLSETGSNLVMNYSWSGSTVCYSWYDGIVPEQSFVYRIQKKLIEGKCLDEKIDTVIILGATNDWWADSPVGEVKYTDWVENDFLSCLPAFCRILDYIRTSDKSIRIINVINMDMKQSIADGMFKACEHYDVECLQLSNLDLVGGHPTALGMKQIKDQIIDFIK